MVASGTLDLPSPTVAGRAGTAAVSDGTPVCLLIERKAVESLALGATKGVHPVIATSDMRHHLEKITKEGPNNLQAASDGSRGRGGASS